MHSRLTRRVSRKPSPQPGDNEQYLTAQAEIRETDMEAALKTEQTQKDDETALEIDEVERPGLGRGVRFDVGEEDDDGKPFKERGPARSQEDLESIGLDFSKCYDTGTADQPRLEGDKLQKLVD
eukprot:5611552-Pleurochrysis_carterae.AAC.1